MADQIEMSTAEPPAPKRIEQIEMTTADGLGQNIFHVRTLIILGNQFL